MELAHGKITLSQWGNSKALRLPANLSNILNFNVDDKLQLKVEICEETGEKRLVIDKIKPQPQTIEELFKGYEDDGIRAAIIEFEAVGNELW